MKTGTINIKIDNMTVGRFCKLKFNFHIDNPYIKDYLDYDDSHVMKNSLEDSNKSVSIVKREMKKFELKQKVIEKLLVILNGEASFKNEENYTEVIVSLKQRVLPEYDLDKEVVTDENVRIKYFNISDKRILIVDDNKTKIKELVRILKPYKVMVDIATNILEMKQAVESCKVYDLIFIDDIIPEPMQDIDAYGNELEYSREIKKDTNKLLLIAKYNIPLVIMVTPNKNSYEEKYLKSGFNDYIIKPIKKSDINNLFKKYFKKNSDK